MTLPPLVSESLAESARVVARAGGAGRVALVDGSTRWTWADLDARADAIARGLVTAGVGAGSRVAVVAAPSGAYVATLHGIARAGAVAAPVATNLTRSELAAAAEVLRAGAVVAGPGLEDAAAMLSGRVLEIGGLHSVSGDHAPTPESPVDPAAPAVCVLTSGTTGRPKAVVLSVAALAASAQSWLAALPSATAWLLAVGLAHVAGIGIIWRAALSGVPLVVLERPEPGSIVTALAGRPAPSHVSLVPTTLARILDVTGDARPPATLRAVPLGGGPVPADLVRRALAAGWPVVPTYGLTEAGSGVTALPTDDAARHPGSAGPALPGVQVRIAAPDPDGIGDIEVASGALFDGYLDDPEATAAAITEDGWLRTGDLGSLDDDGRLTVADRRTDRIVRGGENISPAEVEAVLRDHPSIEAAAVVARPDRVFGQVPVAVIVLRRGLPDPGDEALTSFCRERLARFKVPVAFIRADDLLLTPSGKIRHAAYRDLEDAGPRDGHVDRPDGQRIAYRSFGRGPRQVLLLHGTLSTGAQLTGLARLLAASGEMTVHAVDRRGSGASRLTEPHPVDVAVHVDDLVAILDAEGAATAALVGISYGACVALEFGARRPDRTHAVVAYEPPYGPAADARTQADFAAVAASTEAGYRTAGPPGAAEAFLSGVIGPDAWTSLPDRARAFLADEGGGAYADAALLGFHLDGLAGIPAPLTIVTGDASQPFYRPIADALAARIPGTRRVHLAGMTHASPITDPGPIADAVRAALEDPPE